MLWFIWPHHQSHSGVSIMVVVGAMASTTVMMTLSSRRSMYAQCMQGDCCMNILLKQLNSKILYFKTLKFLMPFLVNIRKPLINRSSCTKLAIYAIEFLKFPNHQSRYFGLIYFIYNRAVCQDYRSRGSKLNQQSRNYGPLSLTWFNLKPSKVK